MYYYYVYVIKVEVNCNMRWMMSESEVYRKADKRIYIGDSGRGTEHKTMKF